MRYSFSDEQLQLRDTVRRFLAEVSPPLAVREQMETPQGYDAQVWQRLHQELGIGGIHISPQYGGAGLSFIELAIVLEEMGRALFCAPYLSSSVLATTVVDQFGTAEQKERYLPDLVAGRKIGTLAQYEAGGRFEPHTLEATVTSGVLTTTKTLVADGVNADYFLVVAHLKSSPKPTFFIVDAESPNIETKPLMSLDWTRKLSEVKFDAVTVERLGEDLPEPQHLAHFFDLQLAAIANEMIGGAAKLLEAAVEYSNERVQFGRSISSLQAIKHKCADLLLDVEFAKSAAYVAAQAIVDQNPAASQYCSLAKATANETYLRAAADCIQIHGGIGFTWENDTHLWFKRAKSSEVYWGTTAFHRERYLTEMGV